MHRQGSDEFMNPNYVDTKVEPDKVEVVATVEEKSVEPENVEESISESTSEDSDKSDSSNQSDSSSLSDLKEPVIEAEQREPTSEELNLSAMRKIKQQAERERDEALRQYRSLSQQQQAPQQTEQTSLEYKQEFNDDDLIEGKHLNKISQEVNQVKQQMNQYKMHNETLMTEAKLKQRYSDFDAVVTKENIELLVAREPELARGLEANPDLFSKAITAYTMIKELKIYNSPADKSANQKKAQQMARDNRRIDENLSKPGVAASLSPRTGDSPLSKASAFSDDYSQEDLSKQYAEMLKRSR